MDSSQVAQLIAEQNQFFMSQSAMASQIGAAPLYGGLGGYGMGGPALPVMLPAPGQRAMPSAINYSDSLVTGYGAGNRFGAAAFGLGAGAAAVGGTAGALALMTRTGSHFAPMFDPFSAFFAARGAGMGMTMSLGAAGLATMPMMAASHAVGSFIRGGQQQSMINTAIGQYQFVNPQSRTGQGFTRSDAQAIGDTIRSLAYIPEMYTSTAELTKLLPKLKDSGLMQGVKDAQEFSNRFKSAVQTIRDVSRILGTTMEGATEFFAHSRRVGYFGKTEQLKNALNVQFTSALTGMNSGQVMQLQQSGADLATAIGARRQLGTNAVTNIAQSLGMAQQSGILAPGLLEDITGKQGDAAVQDASLRMANLAVRLTDAPAGQALLGGLIKFDERGRAIGLDQDLVDRFNAGDIGLGDLKGRMSGFTNAQKISFRARQADLAMDFAAKTGATGMARLLDDLVGSKGGDAVTLLMERYGATAGEADIAQQLMAGQGSGQAELQQALAKIKLRETHIRERTDPKFILKRIGTAMGQKLTQPIEQAGSEALTAITTAFDQWIDDIVGRHIVTVSKERSQEMRAAFMSGNKAELDKVFGKISGLDDTKLGRQRFGAGAASLGGMLATTLNVASLGVLNLSGWGSGGLSYRDFLAQEVDRATGGLGFGDTGVAAWVKSIGTDSTGRSARGRFERMREFVGVGGDMRSDDTRKQVAAAMEALDKAQFEPLGLSKDFRKSKEWWGGVVEAQGIMRSLETNEEYQRADADKRADMIRDEMVYAQKIVSSAEMSDKYRNAATQDERNKVLLDTAKDMNLPGDLSTHYKLARAYAATKGEAKANGKDIDPWTALIAQAKSGASEWKGFQYGQITGDYGNLLDVATRDHAKKKARQLLKDSGIDENTITFAENRPELMNIVREALGGEKAGEMEALLMTGDTATAAAKFREKNIKITPEDVQAMRHAYNKFRDNKETALPALKIYEATDTAVAQTAVKAAAADMSADIRDSVKNFQGRFADQVSNLSVALSDAAKEIGTESGGEAVKRVGMSLSDIVNSVMAMPSKEAQRKTLAKLPEIVRVATVRAMGSKDALRKLDGGKNKIIEAEEVLGALNMEVNEKSVAAVKDMIGHHGVVGNRLSDEQIKKIQIGVAKETGMSLIAAKPASSNDKDTQLIQSLKVMTEAIIASGLGRRDVLERLSIYTNSGRENGGNSGAAEPGTI